MKNYLDLLNDVLLNGKDVGDRTGTGVKSVFGRQLRFDLKDSFPLVTTKKVYTRGIIHELLWFLNGDTNIKYLVDNNVHIWDAWANDNGDLGDIYGKQWTAWRTSKNTTINQIDDVIKQIKENPNSRRLIVSAWNPEFLPDEKLSPQENVNNGKQALPPCHTLFQFNVIDGMLSCQLYQRSADLFLGVPFNIASYSLLTCMIAQVCGLKPDEFIITFGNAHIYNNHIEQIKLQLTRKPLALPKLKLNPNIKNIFDFSIDDIEILDYNSHPSIKGEVAV